MNVKGVTEVGRRLNVARLGLAIVILAAIVYAFVWFFVLRTEPVGNPKTSPGNRNESSQGANSTPAPAPGSSQSDNSGTGTTDNGSSSSPPDSSSGSPSSSAQPDGLVNTGPGDTLAIFAGATIVAYAARYSYLRLRNAR